MDLQCKCGKVFFCKTYLLNRKKYCSKKCFYQYRPLNMEPAWKAPRKPNRTAFKKGQVPWNKGIDEKLQPTWAGDKVGYDGIHGWVERKLGKPRYCEHCKKTDKKVYHWSNKTEKYLREISDWQRLCARCHGLYDYKKFNKRKRFYGKL